MSGPKAPTATHGRSKPGAQAKPGKANAQHPLMGARAEVLLRLLVAEGGVSPRHLPLVAGMLASAAARAPFRLLDAAETARRRGGTPDPVFILGHWRSGTTHLHNLLGQSPRFGIIRPLPAGIPDEMLTLGRWLRPLLERALPENRKVDRVAVRPQSPQEDEIPLASMGAASIYNGLYFPRRLAHHIDRGVFFQGLGEGEVERWIGLHKRLLTKIAIDQGREGLLIKNVAYTARLGLLRRAWPSARFIFIRRNPYEVYASTRNYYRTLLPMLALQPYDHVDIERLVLDTYPRLMDRYFEDAAAVPDSHLAELSYEALVADPIGQLERLHDQLSLPGWERARPRVEAYLDSISDYRRNEFTMSPEDADRVEVAWGRYIDMWGYERPGSDSGAHVRMVGAGV